MFRKRHDPDYTGRHRIAASQHSHRRDPLPPPDMLPAPDPISSEWYDPSRLRGIDPDLIAPVLEVQEKPKPDLPPWMQPRQKVKARYITAAVATALVAVPALMMSGWIANSDSTGTQNSRQAPNTVHMPITLVVNGQPRSVCITMSGSGQRWTAWASPSGC